MITNALALEGCGIKHAITRAESMKIARHGIIFMGYPQDIHDE